jgi:hypothetical protein
LLIQNGHMDIASERIRQTRPDEFVFNIHFVSSANQANMLSVVLVASPEF